MKSIRKDSFTEDEIKGLDKKDLINEVRKRQLIQFIHDIPSNELDNYFKMDTEIIEKVIPPNRFVDSVNLIEITTKIEL